MTKKYYDQREDIYEARQEKLRHLMQEAMKEDAEIMLKKTKKATEPEATLAEAMQQLTKELRTVGAELRYLAEKGVSVRGGTCPIYIGAVPAYPVQPGVWCGDHT